MSENRKYYYMKLKENFFTDAKMVILESMQDGLLYSNLLLKMYLMSLKYITSKEFGENMDAILERVAKENTALIIDHADKSYVLCPAKWFEVPELTQLEAMIKNAVRYVSEVDDSDLAETAQTVKELAPVLSPACITTLLKIIIGKISDGCGGTWCEMKQDLEDALMKANKGDTTETR